jgi:hypothetical protein
MSAHRAKRRHPDPCDEASDVSSKPQSDQVRPSFILFSLHAGLYVLGRRSLTPVILAHSIYHVLGEPYLLMMVFAAPR